MLLAGVKGGAGGHDLSGQREGATVTEESAWTGATRSRRCWRWERRRRWPGPGRCPAQAAGLTSRQLAGQRVIYSYPG